MRHSLLCIARAIGTVTIAAAGAAAGWYCQAVRAAENTPPIIVSQPAVKAYENTAYTYEIAATDSDPLSFALVRFVTDQSNLNGMATLLVAHTEGWQSFTAGKTGWLTAVRLFQNSNATVRTLRLYEGEGTAGALLYQEIFGAGGENTSWRTFAFAN
ncbi:MAG: hypothetical protein N3A66_10705, partial [Planctomycetota bacterium]|nr:hypothetical protein [Planctomycetota bacterium]